MDGLKKLRLMLHVDISTGRCDGARVFDGERLVGALSFEELEKVLKEWRAVDEDMEKA